MDVIKVHIIAVTSESLMPEGDAKRGKKAIAAKERRRRREAHGRDGAWLLPKGSRTIQWSEGHFDHGFSKAKLKELLPFRDRFGLGRVLNTLFEENKLPRTAEKRFIVCSLQKVALSTVVGAFPSSRISVSGNIITATEEYKVEVEKYIETIRRWGSPEQRKSAKVPTKLTICVISGVRHEGDLEMALEAVLQ